MQYTLKLNGAGDLPESQQALRKSEFYDAFDKNKKGSLNFRVK